MLKLRAHTSAGVRNAFTKASPAPKRALARHTHCRAMLPDVSLIATLADAAPGSVDAPISVAVGAAVVVTIAATALVPLALNPGQAAADKIFVDTSKGGDPLAKKKATAKKPAAKKPVAKKSR